jgi:hypothetical protein
MNLNIGDICTTKTLKSGGITYKFKSEAVVMLLGFPKKGFTPDLDLIKQVLIDGCSLYHFDDLIEFLGENKVEELHKFLKKKYEP